MGNNASSTASQSPNTSDEDESCEKTRNKELQLQQLQDLSTYINIEKSSEIPINAIAREFVKFINDNNNIVLAKPTSSYYCHSERVKSLLYPRSKKLSTILKDSAHTIYKEVGLNVSYHELIIKEIHKILTPNSSNESDDESLFSLRMARLDDSWKIHNSLADTIDYIILSDLLIHFLVHCDGNPLSSSNYISKQIKIFQAIFLIR